MILQSDESRKAIPWYSAAAFLTLTWLLLAAEIDGTSLAAHEFYGSSIIVLAILAITIYSLGKSIDAKRGNAFMATTLLASLLFAYYADEFQFQAILNLCSLIISHEALLQCSC